MILFDLALMLLAPDVAEAMNVGTGAHFTLVTNAVASFTPIAGPEAASSSGGSRHLYSQTTQALPVQPADNRRPAKLAEDFALSDSRLACVIGMRARKRSIATILNGTETLKMPAVVTPSICNAAPAPFGFLGAETPRWSQAEWIVGGMVIIAFAILLMI
ncbi:type 2 periplasmic-binding domain-containing protein [Bradyrhizobium elkanii]